MLIFLFLLFLLRIEIPTDYLKDSRDIDETDYHFHKYRETSRVIGWSRGWTCQNV